MKRNIILGINWEQNSSASLMINGRIVDCISEERFSKIKNDERYPFNAINWILKNNNIKANEITLVCFISNAWSPFYALSRHYTTLSIKDYVQEQYRIWYPKIFLRKKVSFFKTYKKKLDLKQYPGSRFWKRIINESFINNDFFDHASSKKSIPLGKKIRNEVIAEHLKIDKTKVKFIDHSLGHSSYAYFASKTSNRKALVLTLDAFGDYLNYTARIYSKGKNGRYSIKMVAKGSNFIIGRLYRYITLILGLKPNEHEYKVMGLAPYCKEKYYLEVLNIFRSFQKVKGLKFVNVKKPKDLYFTIKKLLETNRFDAIAGGLQAYSEELITNWIKNCIKKTGIGNVCLAGGVGLNVKANYMATKIKGLKNLYVPPSPDDSSQSMGACYAQLNDLYNNQDTKKKKLLNNLKPKSLLNSYLGYKIEDYEASHAIKKYNLKKRYKVKHGDINWSAAKLIAEGKIIARVVGKAEFGARSLGNRSILADPSNLNVKKKINEKIKNRDFWMPFAATATYSRCKLYFKLKGDLSCFSYMTNCVETTELGKNKLAAAIHPYDNTCRPQILLKNQNPEYEDLINCFGKQKKIYALLNTSFNLHGKPIVNSAKDAIEVFLQTDLDGIILGKYLIYKS